MDNLSEISKDKLARHIGSSSDLSIDKTVRIGKNLIREDILTDSGCTVLFRGMNPEP